MADGHRAAHAGTWVAGTQIRRAGTTFRTVRVTTVRHETLAGMTPAARRNWHDDGMVSTSTPGGPWWAGGLTLRERLTNAPPAGPAAGDRLARWRAAHDLAATGQFAPMLADAGLTEHAMAVLLAEPPGALAARVDRPAWADTVELAVAAAPDTPVTGGEPPDAPAAFAVPLRPFVDAARAGLVAGGGVAGVDAGRVADGVADDLAARLAGLAARTAVLELNRAREAGRLTGSTATARFADFLALLGTRTALRDLFAEYPVLGRLLAQTCDQTVASTLELLGRFTADRPAIVAGLLGGTDPGELVAVEAGSGDRHDGGRAVAMLRFADGATVVYKPRPLAVHTHFGELVGWLNAAVPGLGLRSVDALVRDGYGWLEYIPHRPCAEVADVVRFYRRQGALLALLYLVDGTDIHFQNLIACGDSPVLVDVETLFHPTLPIATLAGADPAANALAASVHRAAILPQKLLGEHGALDISGLGGDKGAPFPTDGVGWEAAGTDRMRLTRRPVEFTGAVNRPLLGGTDADPVAFEAALLDGFRVAYQAIVDGRDELAAPGGPLDRFAGDEIRIVVRATRTYVTLLDESTHPDVLRDALDRDQLLDALWADSAHDPVRTRLAGREQADLWAGDVPLFTGRTDSRDAWTATGERLPELLDQTGLASAMAKLAGMGEADRRSQEWLITAALATRSDGPDHRGRATLPGEVTPAGPDPERLLAAARGLGDRLVATALHDGHRANWLGVEAIEGRHWSVLPLGAGLADGYPGVALFLAQLGSLTGAGHYTALAERALPALPSLFVALADNPELTSAVGPGGFTGFGGICYALARIAALTGSEVAGWLPAAVELLADSDGDDDGFRDGRAGGVVALLAVHAQTGLARARAVAGVLADRLATAEENRADGSGVDRPAGGFADGPAGTGHALLRYAAAFGGRRHAAAGLAALRRAPVQDLDQEPNHAWCSGVAGTVLAASALSAPDDRFTRSAELLRTREPLRDTSLCHGELGVVEALGVLAAGGDEVARAAVARYAALVLGAIEQRGPCCGTPGAVPTPGLLSGLSGIGYGLLRLGFPDSVPSVLLLESGA